jgi:hypothetical protein
MLNNICFGTYLEEFKKNSKPKTDDYNEFYKLTKIINSALNR